MGDQLEFVDDNEDVRLAGSLLDPGATTGDVLTVQADGSVAAETPGGGALTGSFETFSSGEPTTVLAGATTTIDCCGTLDMEADLIDNTDPAAPVVKEAGIYSVAVTITSAEAFDSTHSFRGLLNGNPDNDISLIASSAIGTALETEPAVGLTLPPLPMSPTDTFLTGFAVQVENNDTISHTFLVSRGTISRIA